jgi:hypothetical protein
MEKWKDRGVSRELDREEFKEKMEEWKDMEFKGKDGGVER